MPFHSNNASLNALESALQNPMTQFCVFHGKEWTVLLPLFQVSLYFFPWKNHFNNDDISRSCSFILETLVQIAGDQDPTAG